MVRAALLALCLVCVPPVVQAQTSDVRLTQGFEIAAPAEVTPLPVGDGSTLRFEIHLTNFAATPLTLRSAALIDAERGTEVAVLSGEALAGAFQGVRTPVDAADPFRVDPGRRVVLFLDVPAPDPAVTSATPKLVFLKEGAEAVEHGRSIRIEAQPPVALGPPLRGGPFTAVYDPMMRGGHRRVFHAIEGPAVIPGRFAIDWMLAPGGPGLGAEVIAVADGVVVAAHDGVAELVPGASRDGIGPADEAGNYVVVDLGEGRFAHFQHLAPGLAVAEGQRVRRGDRLGALGATGFVSGPHLHFHLANGPSLLGSESLPYVFDTGRIVGRYGSVKAAESGADWEPAAPLSLGRGGGTVPPPNAVVVFD